MGGGVLFFISILQICQVRKQPSTSILDNLRVLSVDITSQRDTGFKDSISTE